MSSSAVEKVCLVTPDGYANAAAAKEEAQWWCSKNGIEVVQSTHDEMDLVVSLGGDGTLLRAARIAVRQNAMLVGVHYGTLGFLTAYQAENMFDMFQDAKCGDLKATPRMLMRATVLRDGEAIFSEWAANDCYLKHGEQPRMLQTSICINGAPTAEYFSDGLIVSTPIGSTAYNLAAGGPILDTDLESFVVTPICAHSLTHRPIVIGGDKELLVVYNGPDSAGSLHVDGQYQIKLRVDDKVTFTMESEKLQLVERSTSVFHILREKKSWSK